MTLAELAEGKKVSLAEIAAAADAEAVEALRVKYVGRNGSDSRMSIPTLKRRLPLCGIIRTFN